MWAREDRGDRWPVIALVGSSGGVDALSKVLARLPEGFPAAVLALLHLDPDRGSELPAILGSRCPLPVSHAEHDRPLARGEVRVAPPGCHTLVTPDLRTGLIVSGAIPPSRPSADLLLTSLAMAAGSRAIAVVLSGRGHDGATGATAIHAYGGTVLATDAATSTEFGMPEATIGRDSAINQVVGLEEVSPLLVSLATTPTVSSPVSPE